MRRRFTLLLLLAVGFGINSTRAQQQDPQKSSNPEEEVISLETNLVVLNVTITDPKDRYVTDLKAEDFNVLEDNSPQNILSFGFEETPFAAVILLDASASMEKKLTLERAACANFVNGIREGDKFSIYSFGGTKVKKLQDFTEVRDIPDSVWDMKAEGNTPLYDAIVRAADALARRPERRRAILVVSDGADTQSKATLDRAMRKMVGAYISLYAVDMSDATIYGAPPRDNGAEVMKTMAAKTGGKFFRTPGGNKLREAFASTVDELRRQYTLTYESSNDLQDGRWRSVEVRIGRPKLNVRTRQGYYAQKRKG
jgi:Ca-activated chloride channel family protein